MVERVNVAQSRCALSRARKEVLLWAGIPGMYWSHTKKTPRHLHCCSTTTMLPCVPCLRTAMHPSLPKTRSRLLLGAVALLVGGLMALAIQHYGLLSSITPNVAYLALFAALV